MLIFSQINSLVKLLGNYFFIWSMPLAVIVLNMLKMREIFEINVFIGLVIGIIINVIWDLINRILNNKKYHNNL